MKLYNLTIQPSTAILKVLTGSFSSPGVEQLLIIKPRSIELYIINEKKRLQLIRSEEVFSVIRCAHTIALPETGKDCVIFGTNSAQILILEYNAHNSQFEMVWEAKLHQKEASRMVATQYVAADGMGRAIMVGAVQKQKHVYIFEKKQKLRVQCDFFKKSICISMVALDGGKNSNPIFATIQIHQEQNPQKSQDSHPSILANYLIFYELDLKAKKIVISKKQQIEKATPHMLIPVPKNERSPGGILVVCQSYLSYYGEKNSLLDVKIPFNSECPRPAQYTSYALPAQNSSKTAKILINSELGDLLRIHFTSKKDEVKQINIEYYGTASCLTSMCYLDEAMLFCAGEKEDHMLFELTHSEEFKGSTEEKFISRGIQEKNGFIVLDSLENFGPMTDLKSVQFKETKANFIGPQRKSHKIFTITGSGTGNSHLRVIKQGLKIKQISTIKYQKAFNIWSFKSIPTDQHDKLIIISFPQKTVALILKETGYSQTKDVGIDENCETVEIGRLSDGSLVQIIPMGFRHIRCGSVKPVRIEGRILKGLAKERQMALALAGGDLIFYEYNSSTHEMIEVDQTNLEHEVVSMDFSPLEKDKKRSKFLITALRDNTIRIFDLDVEQCLKQISLHNMKVNIDSILVQKMNFSLERNESNQQKLYVYTGLVNGTLVRSTIEENSGKISDFRPISLGTKAVKCVRMEILGRSGVLALSSRPWVIYSYHNRQMVNLLSFPFMDIATQIRLKESKHAIVGFSDNLLKIISIQNFGETFHSQKIPLTYSGKKILPFDDYIAVLESDRDLRNPESMAEDDSEFTWKSLISVFDSNKEELLKTIKMEENETCTAFTFCKVQQKQKENNFLIVACVTGLTFHPKLGGCKPCLKVYQAVKDKDSINFQFMHKTQIQNIALCLLGWSERVLVGVGQCLRLYEVGRKKLLRKAETKSLSSPINTIKTSGKRIFITEVMDSFHMLKYNSKEQTFYDIADDFLPRYVSSTCLLDDHTIMGADKFENVFVSRVPRNAEQDFENNPNSYKYQWEHGFLTGAPFKFDQVCSYYCGDLITSIEKTYTVSPNNELTLYSTISGSMGTFYPLCLNTEIQFFTKLQTHMRALLQKNRKIKHQEFRSTYSPCRDVIDGDLCETFMKITFQEQKEIALSLALEPFEIVRKIEDIRSRII